MHRTKVFILITALCVCVIAAAAALSGSTLNALWTSGCDFLFHTDNVTVTGTASFSLDGEHFKTARLHYIQDGYSSYYGLKLLTPRADGTERETGWTIIADENGNCAVMEAYEPGVYRRGSGTPQDTLLRRSVRLDALTDLGGLLVAQVEPLLPEGTVSVTEIDGASTVHIAIAEDQIPEVALSALNLAAGYLSDRWFAYGCDRTVVQNESFAFDHYVTVTQALTDGTVRWTLLGADVDFTLDSQGRMTAVSGTVRAASAFWDGSVREVEVEFELAMTEYGESHVKPFDPDDYNVVLANVWDTEEHDGVDQSELIEPEPEEADENPIPAVHKTITAAASQIDPEHVASVTVNARITGYSPEDNELTVELIVPETYDPDEVRSLTVGDSIYTQGREIEIRTLGEFYGYLVINEGEQEISEDSVWLYEQLDGTFTIADWDGSAWITLAEKKVPVRDSLLFLDSIDPSSGESLSMPAVHSAAEFLAMLKTESEEGGPGFEANNVYAVFDGDGQLAVIERYYVPWQ